MGKNFTQHYQLQIDEDLPLYYVHGSYGGVNSAGELEVNLFTDSEALPSPTILSINQDGETVSAESPYERKDTLNIVRTVHSRLLLTADNAANLVRWILDHLDIAEDGTASLKKDQ